MTSKRMGIAFVLVALFAFWSLAGFGMGSVSSTTSGDLLTIGTAYAGDPDGYTSDDSNGNPDGNPQPTDSPDPDSLDEIMQTLSTLASLLVWAF